MMFIISLKLEKYEASNVSSSLITKHIKCLNFAQMPFKKMSAIINHRVETKEHEILLLILGIHKSAQFITIGSN